MAKLAQQPDGVPPAEAFLYLFPVPLAERVPGVPGGSAVDVAAPAAGVLCDMGRDATFATAGDERLRVVELVGRDYLSRKDEDE
jgi:hypothetical protein